MSDTMTSQDAQATSVWFAATARELVRAARRAGLNVAVSFRAPPRQSGVTRTLRRRDSGAVVAVVLVGRSCAAVAGDMVDGVLAANGCTDAEVRALLEAAVDTVATSLR